MTGLLEVIHADGRREMIDLLEVKSVSEPRAEDLRRNMRYGCSIWFGEGRGIRVQNAYEETKMAWENAVKESMK